MALVVITIQDKEDGEVSISCCMEPPIKVNQTSGTPAQSIASKMIGVASDMDSEVVDVG